MKTLIIQKEKADLKKRIVKVLKKYWLFYMFIIPAIVYYIIFCYFPMYLGVVVAMKDYSPIRGRGFAGIFNAEWVGFYHFKRLFSQPKFWEILKNTLEISLLRLVVGFPFPIVFAILLNEIKAIKFKKVVQTVSYLPHFISIVVVVGMLKVLLEPGNGALTILFNNLGMTAKTSHLSDVRYYRGILVGMGVWQGFGWGSILYLATITNVDPELYDAASIDGAGRFQRCIHITLPSLIPLIAISLINSVGSILNAGMQDILLTYSELTYSVADVIDTYVYRMGLEQMEQSYSTAVGLFKGVVGLILIIGANKIANKCGDYGIW